ncbi:unnamed protein product [Absidia cylindrospora]
MRTNACGTANTLWNMLMEKQQQRQQQSENDLDFSSSSLNNRYQKSIDTNDRWSTSSPKHFSLGPMPVDSACQTNLPTPPPPAVMIDCTTQTSSSDILPTSTDSNRLTDMDTKRMGTATHTPLPHSKPPPSITNTSPSYSSFGNSSQFKPSPRSVTSVASSSSISLASSEKSGWFTSVKSWFGGNTGKPESGFHETPLRSSSVRLHNQKDGQPVSYRDFDFCQSGTQQQDGLTSGIYRSGPSPKYQRQTLQSIEWNQQMNSYTTGKDTHNMNHLSTMGGMLSPPPPTATMITTNLPLSIVTAVIPPALPSPAPPAAIYTNNSKNSNNRQCYQNPCLPRQVQQQQPSPPPTPPDAEPTSTIPSFPALSNSNRIQPTSSTKAYQPPKPSSSPLSPLSSSEPAFRQPLPSTPSSGAGMKKSAVTCPTPPPPSSSSPLPSSLSSPTKEIISVLPPTPPTTDEDEKKEWTKTTIQTGLPLPTSSTDSSLAHLKPYSSKSSPALLSSASKNAAIGPAGRRFEFTPRSRLSVYGMNDRAASMTSKAIIEEEEEEEE